MSSRRSPAAAAPTASFRSRAHSRGRSTRLTTLFDSPLSIVAEAILPIRHCVVGTAAIPLEDVREILSHPMALDQCRNLLASLPGAQATVAGTTGDAAAMVAERREPAVVAIASERAARLNGLTVLAANVGDHPEAFTRFAALAPYTRLDRRDGAWRTALTFVTDHRPGALVRAIEPLSRREIDMVQLVSRPIPATPWKYRFDCVLGGHPLDESVSGALGEMRTQTARLRVFGSYRADLEDAGATTVAARRAWSSGGFDRGLEVVEPGEVLAPDLGDALRGEPDEQHRGRYVRLPRQRHRRLLEGPVPFPQVARRARRDDVLPDRIAPA